MRPIVSVIMPAYNSEQHIASAIRSVLCQTIDNLELIIIDDCSEDSTVDIVRRIESEDSRVKLYCNSRNMGAAATRNYGLDVCKGEYVALLDSDDIWYPTKLEVQLALAVHESADIVYCSYEIINESGNKCCQDFIVPRQATFELVLKKSVISCSTALLSRAIIDKYRFPTDYYHEDYVMWLRLLQEGRIAVGVTKVLAAYRIRAKSRASNKFVSAKNRWRIYREFLGIPVYLSLYYFFYYCFCGIKKYMKAH